MNISQPLNILLLDDEASSRGILSKLLPGIIDKPFNIFEANSASSALELLSIQDIDLLFLDVQMPEQNGFDFLRQIPQINFEIIFVTGFDKYAIHAFKFNALDYLLKPVEIKQLEEAVQKAIARIGNKKSSLENVSNLLPSISSRGNDKKIAVHVNDKVIFIEASGISHIVASENYSEIITSDNKKYITPRVLKEFEYYLEPIACFVRVNRSVLLNANFIKSYSKEFPCTIEMKSGFTCEISRRKKADVLKQLEVL
jgi:two-component system LytT family response regulator